MKKTDLIYSVAGSLLLGACSGNASAQGDPPGPINPPEETPRPNFVIMLGDDCSFTDLGCYGSPDAITPNIDKLATQGIKFNKCYQQAPMSSPTRHALYTGVYPVSSGAYPNHTFVYDHIKSFVQYFGDAGYKTGLIGKEHVSPAKVFAYEYLGDYKDTAETPTDDFKYGNIEGFIDRAGDDPFFLVVASREPHTPYAKGDISQWVQSEITLPPMLVKTPSMRAQYVKYLAEINFLDKQVGNVLRILDNKKVADNTVFIFLSEQGSQFPFAKWTCYSQGLQSGMLVRWPEKITAGATTDALVEYVDVLPTCMDIAGIKESAQIEGSSFYPVLKGESTTHKQYAYGLQTSRGILKGPQYFGIRTVRDSRYSYILNFTPEATFQNTFTEAANGVWKSWVKKAEEGDEFAKQQVYNFQNRPGEELYDMSVDPYEMNNLLAADPVDPMIQLKRNELRGKLDAWMSSQGDKGQETELKADERLLKNSGEGD